MSLTWVVWAGYFRKTTENVILLFILGGLVYKEWQSTFHLMKTALGKNSLNYMLGNVIQA